MKNPYLYFTLVATTGLAITGLIYNNFALPNSKLTPTKLYLDQLKSGSDLSPNEVLHKCVADKTCSVDTGFYLSNDDATKENHRVADFLYKAILGKKADPLYYPENEAFNALEYALEYNLCGQLALKRDVHEYQEINKFNFTKISEWFLTCGRTLDKMIEEYHYNETVLHQPYNNTHTHYEL